MPVRVQQQVEDLVGAVHALQWSRVGRLAAVTLAVPPALENEGLAWAVRDALAAAGAPGVEVGSRPSAGSLRVMSVEFAR